MLTEEERLHFICNGYLTKRQIIDKSATDRCREIAWDALNKLSINNESGSWKSHPYLKSRKGVVKLRDEVNGHPELQSLLAENEVTLSVIQDLIGENYINHGVRGIYPTFPIPKINSRPYSAHVEVHDVQIFVMIYLNDVPKKGAGLYIWPGSHGDVYNEFDSKFAHKPRLGFHPTFTRINQQAPFELTGQCGDATFCHHRLLHCGSNNFSNRVRFWCFDRLPE